MYVGIHVKYPLFLPDFNETCVFLKDFSKNIPKSNFIKILAVGAMRTGGQTN
jgi:hypothetical protein